MTAITKTQLVHASRKTKDIAIFFGHLQDNATVKTEKGVALDSAAANDFVVSAINRHDGDYTVPQPLVTIYDELGKDKGAMVTRAMLDGASFYEKEHGCTVPANLLEVAIQQAYSTTREAISRFNLQASYALDSADSLNADPLSLQTNRAVTSVLSTMMSAAPFANYLPFDIGSNQSKLVIVSHQAGLAHGQYALNANMDGANSGDIFFSSSRVHKGTRGTPSGLVVDYTGKLTKVQTDPQTCSSGAGDLKLLKGRAIVYMNGQIAGNEVTPGVISGSIAIGAVTYTVAGVINNDTGVFTVTVTASATAPLGSTVPVLVEGFIDYERDTSITPSIITHVDPYTLHANPWRAFVQTTPDADTQMSNELGIDPASQAMVAVNNQFANERHYKALGMLKRLAAQNADTFAFNWTTRQAQLNAAQVFNDLLPSVGRLSQKMAIDTLSYGIKYWYVGARLGSLIQGLPGTIFEPSGISSRPGIYRIGRLFGLYEVYYSPKVVEETSTTSKILFIGQAIEAARAPIVFGDAVAPIIKPLGIGTDMKSGYMRYERNFTAVNPHTPSSLGCAELDITDLI